MSGLNQKMGQFVLQLFKTNTYAIVKPKGELLFDKQFSKIIFI